MPSSATRSLRRTSRRITQINSTAFKGTVKGNTNEFKKSVSSALNFDSESVSSSSPTEVVKRAQIKRRKKVRSTEDFKNLSISTEDSDVSAKSEKKKRTKKTKSSSFLPSICNVEETPSSLEQNISTSQENDNSTHNSVKTRGKSKCTKRVNKKSDLEEETLNSRVNSNIEVRMTRSAGQRKNQSPNEDTHVQNINKSNSLTNNRVEYLSSNSSDSDIEIIQKSKSSFANVTAEVYAKRIKDLLSSSSCLANSYAKTEEQCSEQETNIIKQEHFICDISDIKHINTFAVRPKEDHNEKLYELKRRSFSLPDIPDQIGLKTNKLLNVTFSPENFPEAKESEGKKAQGRLLNLFKEDAENKDNIFAKSKPDRKKSVRYSVSLAVSPRKEAVMSSQCRTSASFYSVISKSSPKTPKPLNTQKSTTLTKSDDKSEQTDLDTSAMSKRSVRFQETKRDSYENQELASFEKSVNRTDFESQKKCEFEPSEIIPFHKNSVENSYSSTKKSTPRKLWSKSPKKVSQIGKGIISIDLTTPVIQKAVSIIPSRTLDRSLTFIKETILTKEINDLSSLTNVSQPWVDSMLNESFNVNEPKFIHDSKNTSILTETRKSKKVVAFTPKTLISLRTPEVNKSKLRLGTPCNKRTKFESTPPSLTSTPLPAKKSDKYLLNVLTKEQGNVKINESKNIQKKIPTRTKIPNFALIHKKALSKLENIKQLSERKAQRAKMLLSGHKPKDTSFVRKSPKGQSKKMLCFDKVGKSVDNTTLSSSKVNNKVKSKLNSIIPKSQTVTNKQGVSSNKENVTNIVMRQNLPHKLSSIQSKQKDGYNRFGFKTNTKDTTKEEVKLAVANKSNILKDSMQERRNAVKGVRYNRRFELLMNMRKNK